MKGKLVQLKVCTDTVKIEGFILIFSVFMLPELLIVSLQVNPKSTL